MALKAKGSPSPGQSLDRSGTPSSPRAVQSCTWQSPRMAACKAQVHVPCRDPSTTPLPPEATTTFPLLTTTPECSVAGTSIEARSAHRSQAVGGSDLEAPVLFRAGMIMEDRPRNQFDRAAGNSGLCQAAPTGKVELRKPRNLSGSSSRGRPSGAPSVGSPEPRRGVHLPRSGLDAGTRRGSRHRARTPSRALRRSSFGLPRRVIA